MKKSEAEPAIRRLCHEWCDARRHPLPGTNFEFHYSYSDFKTWLAERGYSHYLQFRSVRGADADAELWFDEEMKQTWRN